LCAAMYRINQKEDMAVSTELETLKTCHCHDWLPVRGASRSDCPVAVKDFNMLPLSITQIAAITCGHSTGWLSRDRAAPVFPFAAHFEQVADAISLCHLGNATFACHIRRWLWRLCRRFSRSAWPAASPIRNGMHLGKLLRLWGAAHTLG
jgi:hypothetical protein